MAKPILYYIDISPPTRAVKLLIAELQLDVEYKFLNTFEKEQLKPEFMKINPQHTVPTLDDNGQIIWDSHAICAYLVGKYAKNDTLYPKDLYARARIDQRLHYDTGILFTRLGNLVQPVYYAGEKQYAPESVKNINDSYAMLETFLSDGQYMVGNSLTIADFCIIATVSSMFQMIPLDSKKHQKLQGWIDRMSRLPYYNEINGQHAIKLGKLVNDKLECNKVAA